MKYLLKGQIPEEFQLDYDWTFSEQSDKIYKKLIPELKRLMSGNYLFICRPLQANLPATSKILKCIINYNKLYIFLKSLYFKFNYFSIIFVIWYGFQVVYLENLPARYLWYKWFAHCIKISICWILKPNLNCSIIDKKS